MPLPPNSNFGRYQVLSRLGAGGMGEVYSARDTQLERAVALKVLRADVVADDGRMRRFIQEAKAAAALNHPHIAHIYEIGESEGTTFMAMELIDGETLRQKIHRDKTELKRLLEWLAQVADGLAKAHAAGIVHRDLKPDNIMISRDGYAKILDFGLAKLIEPHRTSEAGSDAPSEIATAILAPPLSTPGMIMGTVGYMSPEQARGETTIDGRSDIFSFGCILYEAVAGRQPFAGGTVVDSLHNIIHAQPVPLKEFNAAIPSDLQRIVRRCLAKDREERYQTIKDVATELKELRREIENEAETEPSTSPEIRSASHLVQSGDRTISIPGGRSLSTAEAVAHSTSSAEYIAGEIKRHRTTVGIGLVVLLLAAVGGGFALYKFWSKPEKTFSAIKIEKLTTNGRSTDAAISPDGKYVVYVLNEGGQQSLWTRQIATTSNVQIIPPDDVEYWALSFSPDSNYINFVRKEKDTLANLFQMPVLGGNQKKLISDANGAVSYSPDGQQFTFVRGNYPKIGDSVLAVANADGSGERILITRTRPETITWWRQPTPAWSPDGKSIACILGGPGTGSGVMNVVEVQLSDNTIKPVTAQGWYEIKRLAWLPDKSGLLILAADKVSAFYAQQIWHVSYPDGAVRRITADFNEYLGMSLAKDSNALVAVQSNRVSNIWVAPTFDTASGAIQIKSGGNNHEGIDGLAWTPDGRIVYYSRASGADDIWIMNGDGTDPKQLTVDAGTNYDFKVTPDGRYIVFTSERTGRPNIWRMDLNGGNPKQLTRGDNDFGATLTPDSKSVIYSSDRFGKPALLKISIDGGNEVQLTEYAAENPELSPDGKLISCLYREDANSPWRYAIVPSDGGKPLQVFDLPAATETDVRWSPDGRALGYLRTIGGVTNIWSYPLDGSPTKPLTDFKSDQIYLFKWSPDGKQFVLARGTRTSDVVLIRDFR
jgi:serine/threonine protein kinase